MVNAILALFFNYTHNYFLFSINFISEYVYCNSTFQFLVCFIYVIDFASLLNKGHRLHGSLTPLFSRLILDGNLSYVIHTLIRDTLT